MTKRKIVILGMMAQYPVAGVAWQTIHYLVGFERLGYEAYYVEAHGGMTIQLMQTPSDDCSALAAAYIDRILRQFDLQHRWCFHDVFGDGRCYGLSESQLVELYRSANAIINLSGSTIPRPEHYATGRLIYLETDPVDYQVNLFHKDPKTLEFLQPHSAFFTFGENYGKPGCHLPGAADFRFIPTRQPVVLDFWQNELDAWDGLFTTIANWRQMHRPVEFRGERYHWSKHFEFLKFIDLPQRTAQKFELALSSYTDDDLQLLQKNGWQVRPSLTFTKDLDPYRDYITSSRGEFTVAKDQNIRLRTGWFSDRSATYLAAGRPVITQETGFSDFLPTGRGLFAFSTMEDILAAVESINSNYEVHSCAARDTARECFAAEVVLKNLLQNVGL